VGVPTRSSYNAGVVTTDGSPTGSGCIRIIRLSRAHWPRQQDALDGKSCAKVGHGVNMLHAPSQGYQLEPPELPGFSVWAGSSRRLWRFCVIEDTRLFIFGYKCLKGSAALVDQVTNIVKYLPPGSSLDYRDCNCHWLGMFGCRPASAQYQRRKGNHLLVQLVPESSLGHCFYSGTLSRL
jgi:hypothetical protein